jgi:hypothetical protein
MVQWIPQCLDANGPMTALSSVHCPSIHPFEVRIPAGMRPRPTRIRKYHLILSSRAMNSCQSVYRRYYCRSLDRFTLYWQLYSDRSRTCTPLLVTAKFHATTQMLFRVPSPCLIGKVSLCLVPRCYHTLPLPVRKHFLDSSGTYALHRAAWNCHTQTCQHTLLPTQAILHFCVAGLWALTYPDGVVETTMWPRSRQSKLCGRNGDIADL